MVKYTCSICEEVFTKKSSFQTHQTLCKQKFDIFTPDSISKEMASHFPAKVKTLLEPSIGTGNLLKYMKYDTCVGYDINSNYTDSITENIDIRISDFITTEITEKFDGIIMNPPYLRYQEMNEESRTYISKNFPELSSGNIDLYLAFILKAFQCLTDDGILVAIIPASFIYNVSSREFRNYIVSNKYVRYIKNFDNMKVFSNADVYCSILVLTKSQNDTYVYETLTSKTVRNAKDEILSENSGILFESYCKKISNGLATLADKVFIHSTKLFDEPCWKPIFKVSTQETRWVIFPYENNTIVPEEKFKDKNPLTYEFLESNKTILENRDKGKKKYKAWYAYGREQSIKIATENCLFIPTLSSETLDKFCIKEPILFYSGICVIPNIDAKILLAKLIESKNNLCKLCSKRSGKWINITVGNLKSLKVLE